MDNNNDSLARLAHANGITDVEHEERLRELARISAEVEQEKERQRLDEEGLMPSADHSELDFPSIEDYGEDWEEYMLHGDPNWD